MPGYNTLTVVVQVFQNGRISNGCSDEKLPAPCASRKRLLRKTTTDYYYIGAQENIFMFSKSENDHKSFT